jgi:hypothetical protein
MEHRTVHSSPVRSNTDNGRPRSSGGGEPTKKKGMGVKEMEQVGKRAKHTSCLTFGRLLLTSRGHRPSQCCTNKTSI